MRHILYVVQRTREHVRCPVPLERASLWTAASFITQDTNMLLWEWITVTYLCPQFERVSKRAPS